MIIFLINNYIIILHLAQEARELVSDSIACLTTNIIAIQLQLTSYLRRDQRNTSWLSY